jgi:hypothetical protein
VGGRLTESVQAGSGAFGTRTKGTLITIASAILLALGGTVWFSVTQIRSIGVLPTLPDSCPSLISIGVLPADLIVG